MEKNHLNENEMAKMIEEIFRQLFSSLQKMSPAQRDQHAFQLGEGAHKVSISANDLMPLIKNDYFRNQMVKLTLAQMEKSGNMDKLSNKYNIKDQCKNPDPNYSKDFNKALDYGIEGTRTIRDYLKNQEKELVKLLDKHGKATTKEEKDNLEKGMVKIIGNMNRFENIPGQKEANQKNMSKIMEKLPTLRRELDRLKKEEQAEKENVGDKPTPKDTKAPDKNDPKAKDTKDAKDKNAKEKDANKKQAQKSKAALDLVEEFNTMMNGGVPRNGGTPSVVGAILANSAGLIADGDLETFGYSAVSLEAGARRNRAMGGTDFSERLDFMEGTEESFLEEIEIAIDEANSRLDQPGLEEAPLVELDDAMEDEFEPGSPTTHASKEGHHDLLNHAFSAAADPDNNMNLKTGMSLTPTLPGAPGGPVAG